MKYKKKRVLTEATQWFRNGDHPEDQSEPIDGSQELSEGQVVGFFRALHIPGGRFCPDCGNPYEKHGLLNETRALNEGDKVCPGDYVVTDVKGDYYKLKAEVFEGLYEPYSDG